MATIDIITAPGTIHIELLDNPFVQKWTTHFSNMLEKYPIDYHAESQPVFNHTNNKWQNLQDLKSLKNIIIKLQDMGTNIPFDSCKIEYEQIFVDHDEGQKILNELHRYFTTAGRSLWNSNGSGYWSETFDSKFTFSKEDEDEFRYYHALINDYVHVLDQSIMTSRKSADFNNQIVNLQFNFIAMLADDCRYDDGAYVQITEEDYQYASDSDEYDVWVGNDILGKDYIEAYYDHDDPSQWDVTSINGHTGRLNINVESMWYEKNNENTYNTLQKLVKREDFQNWLKEYNVKYVPQMCGMPLGKITSGREFAIRKYFKSVYKQEFEIKVNN